MMWLSASFLAFLRPSCLALLSRANLRNSSSRNVTSGSSRPRCTFGSGVAGSGMHVVLAPAPAPTAVAMYNLVLARPGGARRCSSAAVLPAIVRPAAAGFQLSSPPAPHGSAVSSPLASLNDYFGVPRMNNVRLPVSYSTIRYVYIRCARASISSNPRWIEKGEMRERPLASRLLPLQTGPPLGCYRFSRRGTRP